MFPVSKKLIIRQQWREHCARMNAFREVCFKLLAHPDTTTEQLTAVLHSARSTQAAHDTLRTQLVAKGYDISDIQ